MRSYFKTKYLLQRNSASIMCTFLHDFQWEILRVACWVLRKNWQPMKAIELPIPQNKKKCQSLAFMILVVSRLFLFFEEIIFLCQVKPPLGFFLTYLLLIVLNQ